MTRRSFSIPVLVITVVGLAAAAGGFHFVRQWQLSRLSQTFLDRSRQAEQRQEWLAAADDLDRYLHFDPGHGTVRTRLAALYAKGAKSLEQKHVAAALHYRALAAAKESEAREMRIGLAELLLETGRLLEAEREAEQVLQSPPEDRRAARVFALSRYLQWRGGELNSKEPKELKLLSHIEAALALNPADIALAEAGATIYREFPAIVAAHTSELDSKQANPLPQEKRERLADGLLDRAVQRNAGSADALLARHLYRARYGQSEGAAQDLAEALSLAPEHPPLLLVASEARYQEAKEALSQTETEHTAAEPLAHCLQLLNRLIDKKLAQGNAQPHLRLGDALVLQGQIDRALGVWREGLALFDKPTVRDAFHARIADHLLKAGLQEPDLIAEAKPALDAIQEILDTLGGTIRREDHLSLMQAQGLRQATYDLCNGRYAAAIDQLQKAIARQPQLQPNADTSHAAWDLLGRAFAGLQDWAAAATAFDRAANFKPNEWTSRLAAAEAWLSAGRTDLAIDRADQVVRTQGVADAWLVLGTAELQVQVARPPAERNWEQLEQALAALDKSQPRRNLTKPWRIDFLHADYIALRAAHEADVAHSPQAAAEVLRRAELKYQDRTEFWFQACLAYERLEQPQDAERAWQKLNTLPGAQADAAIAASRRAAAREDFTRAASVLESAVPNLTPAAQERLRLELIRLAQAKQDLPRMRALFQGILRDRPHDVGALCGLAELELRAGDFAALEKWERELAAAGPPGDLWAQYFRITRLYTSASGPGDLRLHEALAEQGKLATLRPNWADSFSLRGAIEQRLENYAAAAEAYEQAVQLGERRYVVFEQLIACLDRLNRGPDVEKYLARMQSYLPASQRLTELASARQLDDNQPEQAIAIAQKALARRPNDLSARLWLGRLLLVTERLPEAKAAFEQATRDAHTDARSWSGLFTYYLRTGERDLAAAALESLRQHAELPSAAKSWVLGRGYFHLGDTPQARGLLADAVRLDPKSGPAHLDLARTLVETDRDEAKSHLEQAIALAPHLPEARWLLATLLAASGSEEELEAAGQLLEGPEGAAATNENRRVRAILASQHGGDRGMAEAIEMLEKIVAESPDAASDRLLLAQFYERRAEASLDPAEAEQMVQSARDQFLSVARRTEATAADVGELISFLQRHELKDEAALWLGRLEARLQGQTAADPKAIALFIDLCLKQGDAKRCERWLDRLEAADRDRLRPLTARVRYLASLPKPEAIEPTIEAEARRLMEAAKSVPERGRLARAIGDLYLEVNLLPGAERWYRTVVQLDPSQYPLLATALVRQGRGREAVELCAAAVATDSTSRPALALTSMLLESGAKPELMKLAEPILAAALKKFPDDAHLVYGVAMLRVFEDRYPEAIKMLREVIRLSPQHVAALNNLAMLIAEAENMRPEGLALVERAITHRGHQPTLLDTKGTILMWSGQTKQAVELLEAAARGQSTDPRHSFHLALAYSELGAIDHAQRQLAAAMENHLEEQILTPTDRKALDKLRTTLARSTER